MAMVPSGEFEHVQVLAILLCFLIGMSLGLLGSGGSILTVPILVYLLKVNAKEAIAMSLVVVGITSGFAMIPHVQAGNIERRTGGLFGLAGMAGAFLGGILAGYISAHVLMCAFALMTLGTATAMLCKQPQSNYQPIAQHSNEQELRKEEDSEGHPLWRILLDGFVVGIATGMVGAGGGFLVVPALVFLGGLKMSEAVGTSLMVICMKCFAGYLGHASHTHINVQLTALVSCSAIVGSFAGGFMADWLPQSVLRRAFAVFILAVGSWQLWKESTLT